MVHWGAGRIHVKVDWLAPYLVKHNFVTKEVGCTSGFCVGPSLHSTYNLHDALLNFLYYI